MNHVFILGAGATKAAVDKAPLGQALIWESDYLKVLSAAELRSFLELAIEQFPELSAHRKSLEDRVCLFTPSGLQKQHYADEILRRLIESRRQRDVEFLRQLIYKHIAGAIFPVHEAPLYLQFARDVLRKRDPKRTSVISFNYDPLLREDWEHTDSKQRTYFDYLLHFDWVDPSRYYQPEGALPLIKLNGSFDWLLCEKCGALSLTFYQKHPHDYPAPCPQCQGLAHPQIMLPHEDPRHDFEQLWKKAHSALAAAKRITVIGYSFPVYDTRMRALFMEAVARDISLEIIDWALPKEREQEGKRIREEYALLLPGLIRSPVIRLDGFQAYVKN